MRGCLCERPFRLAEGCEFAAGPADAEQIVSSGAGDGIVHPPGLQCRLEIPFRLGVRTSLPQEFSITGRDRDFEFLGLHPDRVTGRELPAHAVEFGRRHLPIAPGDGDMDGGQHQAALIRKALPALREDVATFIVPARRGEQHRGKAVAMGNLREPLDDDQAACDGVIEVGTQLCIEREAHRVVGMVGVVGDGIGEHEFSGLEAAETLHGGDQSKQRFAIVSVPKIEEAPAALRLRPISGLCCPRGADADQKAILFMRWHAGSGRRGGVRVVACTNPVQPTRHWIERDRCDQC